jgi:octaprenyl-diphosphate synthase
MPTRWDEPITKELNKVEEEIQRSVISQESLLTEISLHVISSGGKRLRPGVVLLAHKAVGGSDISKIVDMAAAFELIHSATLIHDDINDGGRTRRGRESAYRQFGIQKALVTGDFLFVKGFQLGGPQDRKVVNYLANACTNMAESEILQWKYANDPETSIESYLKIIEGKTARPIEAGAKVGAFLGGGSSRQIDDLGRYGLNLGLAFQITDDILDIVGSEATLGKPRGMDFLDGTPTLPLILGMNDGTKGKRISTLFKKKRKSHNDLEEALLLLSKSDALDSARKYALEYSEKAMGCLRSVPRSVYKDSLKALAKVVVHRDS